MEILLFTLSFALFFFAGIGAFIHVRLRGKSREMWEAHGRDDRSVFGKNPTTYVRLYPQKFDQTVAQDAYDRGWWAVGPYTQPERDAIDGKNDAQTIASGIQRVGSMYGVKASYYPERESKTLTAMQLLEQDLDARRRRLIEAERAGYRVSEARFAKPNEDLSDVEEVVPEDPPSDLRWINGAWRRVK